MMINNNDYDFSSVSQSKGKGEIFLMKHYWWAAIKHQKSNLSF